MLKSFLLLVALAVCSYSQEHQHHHPAEKPASAKMKIAFPDLELLDQEGRAVHFYSDLIKGRVVAINFIFTTCTTICPPMGATFSKVQTLLEKKLGKDFFLISVSVDPLTDTPERLKAWSAKFDRKEGWTLVTGNKSEVDRLLKTLGAYTPLKENHTPLVIIGNDASGEWTRAYGLAPAARLAEIIEAAMEKQPRAGENER
jgi:protein SCO1/2